MLMSKMSSALPTVTTAPKFLFIFSIVVLVSFFFFLSNGFIAAAETNMNVGAIVDTDSRVGKEVKMAIEIGIQNFNNNNSMNYKLSPHFQNPGGDPLQAAYAAENLIKEKEVQVIVGMETWQETALVADVGSRAEVPVLSLAAGVITPPSTSLRWPFLVQMTSNGTEQVRCIADMVLYYQWPRVIAIYEDDTYGGDSGIVALLSEALQSAGSEIEYRLVLPPFSSLADPDRFVRNEMLNLLTKQSRVFIVLQSSLSMATLLFEEAKQIGFMWRDSAWIISNTIADLLDSIKYSSLISSMEGSLGIKTYYSASTRSYQDFYSQFQQSFRLQYPEEDNKDPGIYALRAFDAISTITQAINRMTTTNANSSRMLLGSILSSNFSGLSGQIHFNNGELSHLSVFRIVNVVAKSYRELDFWAPEYGFSKNLLVKDREDTSIGYVNRTMSGPVYWPGDLVTRFPKGWAMPTDAKPMKIGVPARTSFEKFVKVEWSEDLHKWRYSGFCIELFNEVLTLLEENYTLPYYFVPYNGTYDALVDHVYNKTFDAVIGDVTILANRSKHVEFTQPYAESGLTMIVPVRTEERAWMFMKPFTMEMWLVTGGILIYTMFVVWFLEHRSNPEFRGPWKSQLGTTFWFTFTSLFFSHRERIHSNFTRVVVVIWLFVVLVLSSSYTASLTSMLTVRRLQPNVTDIAWLKRTRSVVGCDGDSFIRKYLIDVLGFEETLIKNIGSQHEYPDEFHSGNITAAFLELPYERVFMNEYCNKYTATQPTYRFGGLGFAFQKGSPIATDFSEAFLTLSENGKLKDLEDRWFSPKGCSKDTTTGTESLSLQSFWGLYTISGATSTLCCLLFLFHLYKNYQRHEEENGGNETPSDKSVWDKTIRLAKYFDKGEIKIPDRSPTFASPDRDEWITPTWAFNGTSANCTPDRYQGFHTLPAEIEITQSPFHEASSSPPPAEFAITQDHVR